MDRNAAKALTAPIALPNLLLDVAVIGGITVLMIASTFLRARLPFTPVPVTFQTLVVLLGSALAGSRRGAAAQGLYLALGLGGAPVFAGGLIGLAALSGPTGGYLAGFVLAAALVGRLLGGRPSSWPRVILSLCAGEMIILTCGAAYLAALGMKPIQTLALGVVPFLFWDTVKIALAAVSYRLLVGTSKIRPFDGDAQRE
jgi:biotin transport system substrate-specific component